MIHIFSNKESAARHQRYEIKEDSSADLNLSDLCIGREPILLAYLIAYRDDREGKEEYVVLKNRMTGKLGRFSKEEMILIFDENVSYIRKQICHEY